LKSSAANVTEATAGRGVQQKGSAWEQAMGVSNKGKDVARRLAASIGVAVFAGNDGVVSVHDRDAAMAPVWRTEALRAPA
jgi:hypothetical protein